MSTADFWTNPELAYGGGGGGKPVIRHAPDGDNYHFPDWEMLGKMPGSKVGAFAVIPSAHKNGISKAFDGTKAGVVHVDPDCPDGGAVVDLSRVSEQQVDHVMALSSYPHEAYYHLGAAPELSAPPPPQRLQMPEQPRVNPLMPGAYVVPASTMTGVQKTAKDLKPHPSIQMPIAASAVPQSPMLQPQETFVAATLPTSNLGPAPTLQGGYPQAPQMQAAPVQGMPQAPMMPYPGYGYPPPPTMPDPNIAHLTNLVASLTAQVQNMQQAPPPPQQPRLPQLSTMPVGMSPHGMSKAEQRRLARQQIHVQAEEDLGLDRDEDDEVNDDYFPPMLRDPEARRQQQEQQQSRLPSRQRQKQPRGVLARSKRAQTMEEFEEHERRPQRVIAGFETLEIDFIVGPLPEKPRNKVFFEFSRGKQSAVFHGVEVNDALVALIYDTRYEGSQFVPQEMGEEPLHLHVGENVYRVNSMGLTFQLGVLDIIVLVRNDNEEE